MRCFFAPRHENGSDCGLQKSFVDSVLMMLGSMKEFGPSDAAQINAALEDTPYGSEHSARVMAHMDTLLHDGISRAMNGVGIGLCDIAAWWGRTQQTDPHVMVELLHGHRGRGVAGPDEIYARQNYDLGPAGLGDRLSRS